MKKLVAIIAIVGICLSMTACSLVGNSSSQESSSEVSVEVTPTPAPEISEEEVSSEPEVSEAEPEQGHDTESGELPVVNGSDDFIELFNGNDIDSYYLENINLAASVSEMVAVTEKTTRAWETQLNSSYSQLLVAYSSDAESNEKIAEEQSAWASDLPLMLEEIKESVNTGNSMANLEISYRYMLVYRDRCAEILNMLYEKTDGVSITMESGEAVG